MDNVPMVGPLMFVMYLIMMFMVGLLVDGSNTGLRNKVDDLKIELSEANDVINELEQVVEDRDNKIDSLEETLDNLRDALDLHNDLSNPNKRRRIDQTM